MRSGTCRACSRPRTNESSSSPSNMARSARSSKIFDYFNIFATVVLSPSCSCISDSLVSSLQIASALLYAASSPVAAFPGPSPSPSPPLPPSTAQSASSLSTSPLVGIYTVHYSYATSPTHTDLVFSTPLHLSHTCDAPSQTPSPSSSHLAAFSKNTRPIT